jgi:hypothetical protein
MMNRKMLMSLGVGAALAYLASPQSRRNQMRDQFMRASQQARDAFAKVYRGFPARTPAVHANNQAYWNGSASAQGASSR